MQTVFIAYNTNIVVCIVLIIINIPLVSFKTGKKNNNLCTRAGKEQYPKINAIFFCQFRFVSFFFSKHIEEMMIIQKAQQKETNKERDIVSIV